MVSSPSQPLHPPALRAPEPGTRTWLSMGTGLSAWVPCVEAQEAVIAEMNRIEALASTWRADTPWSRLNAARGESVPLDSESLELLAKCQNWAIRTAGAFDPVLAALVRAHGLRGARREPAAETLTLARAASGSPLLVLDPAQGKARLAHAQAGVEEGGFLKGYALDRAAAQARKKGAGHGLLDFGGQLLAWGPPRQVAISRPQDRQRESIRLWLHEASLATTSCTERGRHILDPRSGLLCEAWGSVSVIASSAFDADVLATALYVMGPEAGCAWADQQRIMAVFQSSTQPPRCTRAFTALHPTFLP